MEAEAVMVVVMVAASAALLVLWAFVDAKRREALDEID